MPSQTNSQTGNQHSNIIKNSNKYWKPTKNYSANAPAALKVAETPNAKSECALKQKAIQLAQNAKKSRHANTSNNGENHPIFNKESRGLSKLAPSNTLKKQQTK